MENEKHPLDWNGKLVRFFYDNNRLVWLIIISVMIAGVASWFSLRREGFPAVSIKTVAVQTIYPGATSTEVEAKVTKELEAAIKDAKGMKDFSSTSSNSFSMLTINFDESVSLDQAIQDIQNKIASVKGNLPKDVEQPKVMTFSTGGPSFVYGVMDGNDVNQIRSEAQKLADEIGTVSGVKKASVEEYKDRVNVALKLDQMQARGVTLSTVNQLLIASNVNFPAGTLSVDGREQSVISLGAFKSISDIENIIVGVNPVTRQPVYLKDIATVSRAVRGNEQIERVGMTRDGKFVVGPGEYVSVELTSDADIIKTKAAIDKRIEDAKKDGTLASSMFTFAVYDQAKQTSDQVSEIISGAVGKKSNLWLLGGLQLLFIAMLLLVNWRAALVSALSIPLSFAFTFISLKLTGVQLNTIVLFSFILVLGLIVDPAIVMIEAIQRYRDLKYSARDAVIESGRRYGASLFMAVLTSLLVFVPFGVVSGYFGQIIKYIPLTIVPALLASYFVPMALLPYLTKKLLHKEAGDKDANQFGDDENLSKPAQFVMGVNAWVLGRTWRKIMVITIALLLFVGSIFLVAVGKVRMVQFATPEDNQMLSIQATYNHGMSFTDREKAAKSLENVLVQEKSVKEFFFLNQSKDNFWMYVNLKDQADRKDASEKSKEIVKRIKAGAASLTDFSDLIVSEVAVGPPSGSFQIQTQLASNDLSKLESASKTVGEFLGGQSHVTKVDDGFSGKNDPQVEVRLNRDKVALAGLSSYEIGTQLKGIIDETQISKFDDENGKPVEVYLTNGSKPGDLNAIKKLPLVSRTGTLLTVGDVAEVARGTAPGTIERYNGQRFATVQARVDEDKNVAVVQNELNKYLTSDKLKELGIDSKLNKGQIGDISKSFTELGVAMIIAIVLTYVFLVLQFKSFSLPGIMLFTIPLSMIGVFPALWIVGSQLGFLELLGVTILIGIVENVAIFLIDYANQLRRERGMTAKEAIIQASGVRFRPILLTKLVALGGLLPLAIESPMWRGLSIVIIAGIGLSGFFSLVIIPILYVWIERIRDRVHKPRIA